MNIVDNSLCRLCNADEETIEHLFVDCKISQNLWKGLQTWIRNMLKINISLTKYAIVMGYQYQDQNFMPINAIIIKTKHYIFRCANGGQSLNFTCLQYEIKKMYNERELLSKINSKHKYFQNVWKNWDKLFG